MTTEINHIRVDKNTRLESLLRLAGSSPVIVELDDAAYRINPVGATSSPFTAESAYASIRTVDGRSGAEISDDELELMIDQAKAGLARRLLEDPDIHA